MTASHSTPRYDFDRPIDRRGSGALKYEVLAQRYGRADLLPLWVADMDWETPPFIMEALSSRLQHPLYGYTVEPTDLYPTIARWVQEHHGWALRPEWITYIPGIVRGIGLAINLLTRPEEKIIIQPPVYHPFRLIPEGNGRRVVDNPLRRTEQGTYVMDFDHLERCADDYCRMLLLCNPHNPGGVTWDRTTLCRLADFCDRRGIIVVSDEIHADMALFGNCHLPFASVSEAAARCSITFGAPSKTFNMAGIVSAWAAIPDDCLRNKFYHWLTVNELNDPPLFAPIATLAAYRYGESWRKEMLAYVEGNIEWLEDYCRTYLPAIRPLRPQASFFVWLDCRALGLSQEKLVSLFIEGAGLALNDGAMFGQGGEGFMRLNVGTQRATLYRALDQLRAAITRLPL